MSPIALFVYDRPWHTKKTVEALQRNKFAPQSKLFIFSDAPKLPHTQKNVDTVREYIQSITGFKSVQIIERQNNMGLAESIIDGVTRVCKEYGRVVVLEDDLITSPYFLRYMNDALDFYQYEERVISIHGYFFPVKQQLSETFFLRGADCWGWATWQRGWDIFEPDGEKLLNSLREKHLESEFNFGGSYDYLGMLESQVKGENDSWAIRWYASAFLQNKLTLNPGKSLVLNIGTDSSGTHSGQTEMFSGAINNNPVSVGGIRIEESQKARSAVTEYYLENRNSLLQQTKKTIQAIYQKLT